jgi:hypothetical protein
MGDRMAFSHIPCRAVILKSEHCARSPRPRFGKYGLDATHSGNLYSERVWRSRLRSQLPMDNLVTQITIRLWLPISSRRHPFPIVGASSPAISHRHRVTRPWTGLCGVFLVDNAGPGFKSRGFDQFSTFGCSHSGQKPEPLFTVHARSERHPTLPTSKRTRSAPSSRDRLRGPVLRVTSSPWRALTSRFAKDHSWASASLPMTTLLLLFSPNSRCSSRTWLSARSGNPTPEGPPRRCRPPSRRPERRDDAR